MIFSAGRILELSVAANIGSWLQDDRQQGIDCLPRGVRKKVSQTILNFALQHPTTANASLNAIATLKGFRYLGSGVEFSAYHDIQANQAVKLHRKSAELSVRGRADLAVEKYVDHSLLKKYLGSTVLNQTIEIAEHPLGGGYEVLQIRQPLLDFASADAPFATNDKDVNRTRLEAIVRKFPGIDSAFEDFINRSRSMYFDKDVLPDTNGTNNIVAQTGGTLSLLDTSSVGTEHPGVQLLILDQLNSLETGLREVA